MMLSKDWSHATRQSAAFFSGVLALAGALTGGAFLSSEKLDWSMLVEGFSVPSRAQTAFETLEEFRKLHAHLQEVTWSLEERPQALPNEVPSLPVVEVTYDLEAPVLDRPIQAKPLRVRTRVRKKDRLQVQQSAPNPIMVAKVSDEQVLRTIHQSLRAQITAALRVSEEGRTNFAESERQVAPPEGELPSAAVLLLANTTEYSNLDEPMIEAPKSEEVSKAEGVDTQDTVTQPLNFEDFQDQVRNRYALNLEAPSENVGAEATEENEVAQESTAAAESVPPLLPLDVAMSIQMDAMKAETSETRTEGAITIRTLPTTESSEPKSEPKSQFQAPSFTQLFGGPFAATIPASQARAPSEYSGSLSTPAPQKPAEKSEDRESAQSPEEGLGVSSLLPAGYSEGTPAAPSSGCDRQTRRGIRAFSLNRSPIEVCESVVSHEGRAHGRKSTHLHYEWVRATAPELSSIPTLSWVSDQTSEEFPILESTNLELLSRIQDRPRVPGTGMLLGTLPAGWTVLLSPKQEAVLYLSSHYEVLKTLDDGRARAFYVSNLPVGMTSVTLMNTQNPKDYATILVPIQSDTLSFIPMAAPVSLTLSGRILPVEWRADHERLQVQVVGQGVRTVLAQADGSFEIPQVRHVPSYPLWLDAVSSLGGHTHRYKVSPRTLEVGKSLDLNYFSPKWVDGRVRRLHSKQMGPKNRDGVLLSDPSFLESLKELGSRARVRGLLSQTNQEVLPLDSEGKEDPWNTHELTSSVPEEPAVFELTNSADGGVVFSEMGFGQAGVVWVISESDE
jgi:hypothetical protein